jgi:hypothetical protein
MATPPNSQVLLNLTLQAINALAQNQNPLINTNIPNLTMNSSVGVVYSAYSTIVGTQTINIQGFGSNAISNSIPIPYGLIVYVRNAGAKGTLAVIPLFNTLNTQAITIPLGPGDVFLYFAQQAFSYQNGVGPVLQNGTYQVGINSGDGTLIPFEYLIAG